MNKEVNTTQQIGISFIQRAISTINKQLAVEIERNGFSMAKIQAKKTELVRRVTQSETNPDIAIETFSITLPKGKGERVIMAVKWLSNKYEIEVNSDAVANAVKKTPDFGIKKDSPFLVTSASAREIEIEARANEYEKNSLKIKK